MRPKLCYSLLVLALAITTLKGDEVNHVEIVESLNPLKVLKGLQALNTQSRCLDDIKEYVRNLQLNKLWAVTMFDSSAKIPEGLLLKNSMILGQFDECIGVEHPNGNFTGQHCMLNVNLYLGNNSIYPKTYADEVEEITPDLSLLYGICLPSTCSPPEITTILQKVFNLTNLANFISVTVDAENCQTKESLSPELTAGDWVVVGFLAFIIAIALTSTCYDVHQQFVMKNKKPHPLLASFSIYSNGAELFKTSKTSGQMEVLHGIRVFSILWVILVHDYENLMYFSPIVDLVGTSKRIMDHNHVLTYNGYLAVDSFLFLSGLLCCFVFLRDMAKKGYYDVPLGYIHRYIRLTPPYAVVILITATIFPYFGNGPLWHKTTAPQSNACKENWYLGILYVQNYVSPDYVCLGQSWYLSTDMQLHWISPFILYPIFFWPSLAPYILCTVILGAAFTTFAIGYVNDLGPSVMITTSPHQVALDYNPFHTRAAPWLIGLAVGYIICTIKAKKMKIKLSKFWVVVGWVAAAGLCLGSLYGIIHFTDSEYTTLESAFYLAFHRVGWGLGLAWIVLACIHGYGGPVNTFLSWSVFQVLGKTTYCTFLAHLAFQFYRIGILRVNIFGSDYEQAYYFLGDAVLSHLAALPLTLLFEIPFGNMYKYFFSNIKILPLPRKKNIVAIEEINENDVQNRKEKQLN